MMISKNMEKAINAQIGNEFGASLQYVMVSSHFEREGLPRLADFFADQAEDEHSHAMRFVDYLNEVGGVVRIPSLEAGRAEFKSAEEAVKRSLDWEQTVTKQINDLVGLAIKENDHLTRGFLQWFVDEQLEEVNTMQTLLGLIQRAASLLEVELYLAQNPLGHAAEGEEAEEAE